MARRNTVPYSKRALEGEAYDKRARPVHDAAGAVIIEDAVESPRSADSEAFLFPASFAQQRLWFFEQLYPGSPVYHLSTVLPFEGPLDRKALEDSLCDLLDRHEALRTTFTALDGVPVQLIAPGLRLDLPLVDVSQASGRLSGTRPRRRQRRPGRPLRSCPRPAAARQPVAARDGLSLAGAGAPSYRCRWLVAGDPASRSARALCRQGQR